ncbi:MAG TPA: PAS domain S-box protein [Candidatus Competibacter sp.]|nr:PAS domain S-box protein [Candidatus Competibacteraceae bacterium]HPE72244.1 PAS domain S-box protein [Candidatus Competibacter sp.]HRW67014.1 PAS domain S-box protein [Candidatus Competibacter sp.]
MNPPLTSTDSPDTQDQIHTLIARLLETETTLRALTDGRVDAILDPSGQTYLLRQAQASLQASEERYHRLVDHMAAIVVELGPDGTTLFVNTGVTSITGYTPDELIGRNWYATFLPEAMNNQPDMAFEQFARGEDVVGYESKIRAKDGSIVVLEWNSANRYRPDGSLEMLVGLGIDITKRKRIEQALQESEARFRLAFDQAPIGAALVSLDYRFLRVNETLCRITGYSSAELTATGFPRITHPDDRDANIEQARQLVAGEIDRCETDTRYLRKDGSVVWVHLSVHLMKDAACRPLYFLPMMQDISARRRAEEQLRESERFAHATIDGLSAHLCVLDETGTILSVNQPWRDFGQANPPLSANAAEGANYLAVCDCVPQDRDAAAVARGIRAVMCGETPLFVWEYPCHSSDEQRWFVVRVTRFPGAGPVRLVVVHQDITQRKIAERRAHHLANFDALTHLPNRNLLQDRLLMALHYAQRHQQIVLILLINLSRFKLINDSLGLHVGDQVLRTVANRLEVCIRATDTLARVGGDEFVLVSPGHTVNDGDPATIRRVLDTLVTPVRVDHHTLLVTCNIGISTFPKDGRDCETLLCNASVALERAKMQGGGVVELYTSSMNDDLHNQLNLETALR